MSSDTLEKPTAENLSLSSGSRGEDEHSLAATHTPSDAQSVFIHAAKAENEALQYAGHDISEFSPKLVRRLVIKSWTFYLLASFSYGLFFLDKIAVSSAALLSIRDDLHMTGNMFPWTTTSYFIGYLVFTIPLSLVLVHRLGIRWAGAFMLAWGAVVMCMAACQNYAAFIACRVLLGVLESPFVSALNTLTAQWLPKRQHYSAATSYFSWCGWGVITANALGYGLYIHSYPIAAWRILFLILGGMTLVNGVAWCVLVPNSPAHAFFLSEEEKECLVARTRENKSGGFGSHKIKWYQIREVFTTDAHHTALLFVNVLCNCIVMGAITTYQSVLVQGIVHDTKRSLLMTMPGGGIQFGGCYIVAALSLAGLFANCRSVYMIGSAVVNVVCTCLISWGPNDASQLAGIWIWNLVGQLSYSGFLSLVQSNSAGSTKRALMSGIVLAGYSAGNAIGPQAGFPQNNYPLAKRVIAALTVVSLGLQVAMVAMNVSINKKRDARGDSLPDTINDPDLHDLTDYENPTFRYSY